MYSTLEELNCNIEDFIERYYNCERLHSALAYWPPQEFERQHAAATSNTQSLGVPVALSFRGHQEIYLDTGKLKASESGEPLPK